MQRSSLFGLALAVFATAGMWLYVQRVLIPYQVQDAAAHGRPRGVLSDLYPRWVGAQELMWSGKNPYSDEVTTKIQTGYYGRPIDPARPGDPRDEQRFAYPVYVTFLLAPWLHLPFDTARWVFSVGLLVLTATSVPLWLRVVGWKVERPAMLTMILLTVSSFAAVQGVKLQQLSLLVAVLIALCLYSVASQALIAAGLCLSLASIKPQLMAPLVLWLALWTVADWPRRQKLFWSFLSGMALLVAAGEYILPGWIGNFLDGMAAYERYTGGGSLLDVLAGRLAGSMMTLLILIMAAVVSWRHRHTESTSAPFSLVTAFVLAATALVIPMMAPYNHLILLPAILLVIRHRRKLWSRGKLTRLVCAIAAIVVAWPWPAALGLGLASIPDAHQVLRFWAAPLWTSLAIPLAIFPLAFALVADQRGPGITGDPDSGRSSTIRSAI